MAGQLGPELPQGVTAGDVDVGRGREVQDDRLHIRTARHDGSDAGLEAGRVGEEQRPGHPQRHDPADPSRGRVPRKVVPAAVREPALLGEVRAGRPAHDVEGREQDRDGDADEGAVDDDAAHRDDPDQALAGAQAPDRLKTADVDQTEDGHEDDPAQDRDRQV